MLRREWEMRVQDYEDEDEDEEPSLWTRVRSLLLNLSLQLYHRFLKLRQQLQVAADTVGLTLLLQLLDDLLQNLGTFTMALVYRVESLRDLALVQVKGHMEVLLELGPVQQVRQLPVQVQQLVRDLQELTKLLVQLVINATPLYQMLQQSTEQDVEDFLSREDFMTECSSRHSSTNSLFLKAMDGRPPRRRSLFSRAGRRPSTGGGTALPNNTQSSAAVAPSGRWSSLKQETAALETEGQPRPSEGFAHRRPSATDLLLAPLKQFVSQSQKAFEYLNPGPPGELGSDMEETDDC
ncbi:hypothetical protein LDENG_00208510 [Lucifuga dentata]|nr:hypothetical protein LDENG_00208510 [Lucifuga dentata]